MLVPVRLAGLPLHEIIRGVRMHDRKPGFVERLREIAPT